MIIYVVLVKYDRTGWKIMTRKRSSFHQRLCTYDTHEGAEKAINNMKFSFPKDAQFRIVEYGELEK